MISAEFLLEELKELDIYSTSSELQLFVQKHYTSEGTDSKAQPEGTYVLQSKCKAYMNQYVDDDEDYTKSLCKAQHFSSFEDAANSADDENSEIPVLLSSIKEEED